VKMSHWFPIAAAAVTIATSAGIPPARAAQSSGAADLDPGASQTGKADCAKILWVGGYRVAQPGSCDKPAAQPGRRRRHGYTDKADKQAARDAQEAFKQERKAKREEEKAKEKAERDARKAKDEKAKKCRGLGLPANCDLDNPGHTGGSSPKKTKGRKP
jgi:hypothetical protein